MRKLTLFIFILSVLACSSIPELNISDSIVGEWELLEDCFSIGSAELQCNEPNERTVLTFAEDNRYVFFQGSSSCSGNFTLDSLNRDQLEFVSDEENCIIRSGSARVVLLNSRSLELSWFGCIEPCISRYNRME